MAEALEQKALHTVTIKANKVVWIIFGKEILIDGHLFDVEFYKKAGDNLMLTGLYDTEEDRLNEQMKMAANHKSESTSNQCTLLVNLLFQTFFKVSYPSFLNTGYASLNQYQVSFAEKLYSISFSVIIPPPKG